ncbi:MAG: hypothetical protein ACYTKD_27900 [Planctomycetota bacterium]|jgi:hypothetical protein
MDGLGSDGRRGFDDVVAELNNTYTATYGLATLLAREHAPDTAPILDRELERYRRLVAELREFHRSNRPE